MLPVAVQLKCIYVILIHFAILANIYNTTPTREFTPFFIHTYTHVPRYRYLLIYLDVYNVCIGNVIALKFVIIFNWKIRTASTDIIISLPHQ